jgi:hypothetical protein
MTRGVSRNDDGPLGKFAYSRLYWTATSNGCMVIFGRDIQCAIYNSGG